MPLEPPVTSTDLPCQNDFEIMADPPLLEVGHQTESAREMQPVLKRVLVPVDGHVVAAEVHLRDDPRPPVVFMHGLLASVAVASELFDEPADESWIALSLPGHHPGRLAPGTPPSAIDERLFARLAEAALVEVLGDRRVLAAGWSTGGFAAINLAIHHPHRVAAVASLAGFAGGRVMGSVGWLQWLAGGLVGRAGLEAGMRVAGWLPTLHDAIVRSCAADRRAAAAVPAATLDRMRADFVKHDPASLVAVLAALQSLDIGSRLDEVRVPTWVAAGERDPVVPPAEARRLATAIRGATLRVYGSAGHLFFCEWPSVRADFAAWRNGLAAAGSP